MILVSENKRSNYLAITNTFIFDDEYAQNYQKQTWTTIDF